MSTPIVAQNAQASTSSAAGNNNISQALGESEMGQMFLKLLVAQVQYQDPLEPTDSSTFVTQLTQLSQTESLQNLQSQLSKQSSILDSMQTLQLGGHVGKDIMVATSSILLADAPVQGAVSLETGAALTLQLTSADGKVTSIDLGAQPAGDVNFSIDPAALGLPAGRYSVAVTDANGSAYMPEVQGRLNAVRLTPSGTVAVQVQGLGDVLPASITRFIA